MEFGLGNVFGEPVERQDRRNSRVPSRSTQRSPTRRLSGAVLRKTPFGQGREAD